MSNLSQFVGGGKIKSIQRGAVAGGASVTISPVNTSKSILYNLGCANGYSSRTYVSYGYNPSESFAVTSAISLTSSTTISCSLGSNLGNTNTFLVGSTSTSNGFVSWQLVEYY